MRRREMIGAGGLAAAVAALGIPVTGTREDTWANVPCPGCQRPVAFLASQKVNRCAWCETKVARGLV